MMNSTKKRILCGFLALFALVSVPKLSAQGIDVAWANSLTAMRADKWAEAHQILDPRRSPSSMDGACSSSDQSSAGSGITRASAS